MRFLYKRQPANELELEIREVRQVMASGGLILFDLFFYSLIFAMLIVPVKAGFMQFSGLFLIIYVACTCIFLFIRRSINKFRGFNHYF